MSVPRRLNDDDRIALMRLAKEAGLTGREIIDVIRVAQSCSDPNDCLDHIARLQHWQREKRAGLPLTRAPGGWQ